MFSRGASTYADMHNGATRQQKLGNNAALHQPLARKTETPLHAVNDWQPSPFDNMVTCAMPSRRLVRKVRARARQKCQRQERRSQLHEILGPGCHEHPREFVTCNLQVLHKQQWQQHCALFCTLPFVFCSPVRVLDGFHGSQACCHPVRVLTLLRTNGLPYNHSASMLACAPSAVYQAIT
jgi:hypothetical protein